MSDVSVARWKTVGLLYIIDGPSSSELMRCDVTMSDRSYVL